ncbi:hypothetical protein VNO77_41946 [Canavalia gladiata]|uniref:Uncharacterized protein n=1 Tax=Canavalia gladiata TaxID=3824 RepID=A0AAN9PS99_CANGL
MSICSLTVIGNDLTKPTGMIHTLQLGAVVATWSWSNTNSLGLGLTVSTVAAGHFFNIKRLHAFHTHRVMVLFVLVPIAAGVLYPFVGIKLPPWLASAYMVASSLSVVSFSLLFQIKNLCI